MVEMVNLTITNSLSSFASERRFGLDTSISVLKGKLELVTGCLSAAMKLELYDKENKFLHELEDGAALRQYPIKDGMRLHVINQDPTKKVGEFEDISQVEKYEIAEGDYDKREDSVRNFLKKQKLGRFSEAAMNSEKEVAAKEKEEETLASSIKPEMRCEICVAKQPTRRGTVRFVGLVDFKPGYWVGIQYDEPVGKNDGSVKGKRYFECPNKYGGFVRPSSVTVGDFEEEDLGLDDEM